MLIKKPRKRQAKIIKSNKHKKLLKKSKSRLIVNFIFFAIIPSRFINELKRPSGANFFTLLFEDASFVELGKIGQKTHLHFRNLSFGWLGLRKADFFADVAFWLCC
jgi:hypothetical protein